MEIKKDENGEVIEPTTEELKAELSKIESEKAQIEVDKAKAEEEKENYKKGLLEREAKLKEIKGNEKALGDQDTDDDADADKNENKSNWDEDSLRFQEETLSKTQKAAEEAANKAIETKNEKQAIADFREANPEITDEKWEKIALNYNPKNGKDSPRAIIRDLERAEVLRKFDAGEKIDPAEMRKTEAQENIRDLSSNAGAGNSGKYEGDNGEEVSEGQLSIATRMRVDKEALEKEDDSLSAEISIS